MKLILTRELLNNLKTDTGCFTGNFCRKMNIKTRCNKGWSSRLIGTEIDAGLYGELLEERNLTVKKMRENPGQLNLFGGNK